MRASRCHDAPKAAADCAFVSFRTRATPSPGTASMRKTRVTGPGLSTDDIIQVFEPFYRADPSRNMDTGGDDGQASTSAGLSATLTLLIADRR